LSRTKGKKVASPAVAKKGKERKREPPGLTKKKTEEDRRKLL